MRSMVEGVRRATQPCPMPTAPSTSLWLVPLPAQRGGTYGVSMNPRIGNSYGADRSASFIA